jgi:hypothetical protein
MSSKIPPQIVFPVEIVLFPSFASEQNANEISENSSNFEKKKGPKQAVKVRLEMR